MANIVIIGAGLTGLSTAYHLEQKGFFDYRIFEKESSIGGLCRSVHQDGFTFDFTGHLLHINDDYVEKLVEKLVGFEAFNTINRRSWIYSQNSYTPYPYQVNLRGLPTATIAECIQGFITRPQSTKKPKNFYDWVMQHFGAGFGKHFFFPYQRKIFAHDIKKITASWTGRFVPSTSIEQILDGIMHDPREQHIGYNAQFFYPKQGGIISWVEPIAKALRNTIYTDFCVSKIDTLQKVVHFTNGHAEPYEQLITTMPLDTLLYNLKESSATSLYQAAPKLLCNSVVNFNLGVARPDLSDKHWIYYPEKQYPFYRLGFPHNFAQSSAPADCSSLYGEFAYLKKTPQYVAKTLRQALHATKNLLTIKQSDILTEKILYIPHAYVIYDAWREQHLPGLLKTLESLNIYSVGRYGEWKYASMQESILDGKNIADRLIIQPATTTQFIDYREHPLIQEKVL